MSQERKVLYMVIAIVGVFFSPLLGLYISEGKIPEDFFYFPATDAADKPGLNYVAIAITCVFWLAYLLLIFFPRIYGFKKTVVVKAQRTKMKLPSWFWIGLVLWATIIIVFYAKITRPKPLVDWALVPLWWGFILILDGIVYVRNEGKSLVRTAPSELIAMGILSISGWLIFEYFNFFIKTNWYYPAAKLVNHDTFLLYSVIGSSAFIPMAFEWYHLLRTIPALSAKYKSGPVRKASLSIKIVLLTIAFTILLLVHKYPNSLFYSIWLSPLIVLLVTMSFLKIWTPFTPIKERGDWTALIVFSLVWLLQGIFIEWWNHLSYEHAFAGTANPGYWEYCLPYVNIYHVFNMPALGYLGYVPFSIYCCTWFVAVCFIMGIGTKFSFSRQFQ